MTKLSRADHIREIERVARGLSTGRDPLVVSSWRRCLESHRLDPARNCEAFIVPASRLREHRQQSEDLIHIARSGLENLFGQVAGQGYVLLLADRQGVTVEFLGEPAIETHLRKSGLYLGAEWSEHRAGTCAVGACLETGEALTIHQTDHFDNTHTPLSCTAAPIYDTHGELSAVLDISLLTSPVLKASQNLALHLVTATARRIELANLMAHARDQWVLRFSRSPEFLDVDPEAAISIDGSGRIAGMTHGGARILARSAHADWRDPARLIGQPVSRFFELDVDDLPSLTRRRPTGERLVVGRDGNALFAHAIEAQARGPRSPRSPAALPAGRPVATDPAIAPLEARAARLARTMLPILLQGETGSGKEHLARTIHAASGLAGRFVAVNCAAIPEQLIESELFGHLPGAFTGASAKGRKGLIEQADGGTLFLDEIGDMPFSLQSRLLRVLAENEVLPVGGTEPRPVRIRVISASHRDLPKLVAAGSFREDLYYRLDTATLTLPPLRDRADFDDIVDRLLVRHAGAECGLALTAAARARLRAHRWPGNIRELDNTIAFAAAVSETGLIDIADLPDRLREPPAPAPSITGPARARFDDDDAKAGELDALLAACRGNVSEVARRLGVDRTTVHRRIRRHGLRPH